MAPGKEKDERDVFITDDAVLVSGRGFMDPVDITQITNRRVMSLSQALDYMEQNPPESDEPEKPLNPGDVRLDRETLEELGHAGLEGFDAHKETLAPFLLAMPSFCQKIRDKRVKERYSWRALARWASQQPGLHRQTMAAGETANQIFGMALCAVAADTFDEHYLKAPWNDLPGG